MKTKVKTIRGVDDEDLHANLTRFIGDPNVEMISVSYPDDDRLTAVIIYKETYYHHP